MTLRTLCLPPLVQTDLGMGEVLFKDGSVWDPQSATLLRPDGTTTRPCDAPSEPGGTPVRGDQPASTAGGQPSAAGGQPAAATVGGAQEPGAAEKPGVAQDGGAVPPVEQAAPAEPIQPFVPPKSPEPFVAAAQDVQGA